MITTSHDNDRPATRSRIHGRRRPAIAAGRGPAGDGADYRRSRHGVRRAVVIAATAAGTCLLIAACSATPAASGQPSRPAGRQPGRQVSTGRATGSPRPAPTSPGAPTASARPVSAPQPPPICTTADLRGSIGAPNGAAGTFYYPVQFTNVSATACVLQGYPGVSVVASPGGAQIGPAATRIPTFSPRPVHLAPGQVAHAPVLLPDPGDFGPGVCDPVPVHWLRVYPPGQYSPLYIGVPAGVNPMSICTGTSLHNVIALGTFVVLSGSTGP